MTTYTVHGTIAGTWTHTVEAKNETEARNQVRTAIEAGDLVPVLETITDFRVGEAEEAIDE